MNGITDQLPNAKQQDIQFIKKVILDEFEQITAFSNGKKQHNRTQMIILFGSYTKGCWVEDIDNGYISDYDILVILNKDDLINESKLWHTIEDRISRKVKPPVNIIVHTLVDVNNQITQGHYFFTDIKKDGIELYNAGDHKLIEAGTLSKREAKQIAEKHFKQWFESANEFLISFQSNLERKSYKLAAFELHQATEHYYACLLLVLTNYKPKTHGLRQLGSMASQQDPDFKNIFPQDNKFNRNCFELLRRAYIDARYSEHYQITEDELSFLAKCVQHLKTLTQNKCQEKMTHLG